MLKSLHWERYKVCRESWESQRKAGRYNPASVLILKASKRSPRVRCVLSCGDSDDVSFYTDRGVIVVVSMNRGLDYCGLQVFSRDEKIAGYPVGESMGEGLFLQGQEQIEESLGRKGLDLSDRTIARRLYGLWLELSY